MVQKDAGISLTLCIAYCMKGRVYLVEQKGAGISLLCVGYLLQEGGCNWWSRRIQEYQSLCVYFLLTAGRRCVPGGSEGCRNITALCVTYCRKEGVPGGSEGCRN